jgi:hypothetical protein
MLAYCRSNKGKVHFLVVFNPTRFARDTPSPQGYGVQASTTTSRALASEITRHLTAVGDGADRRQPLSSQAIAMLLRNRVYIGIIDVPEFGVREQRGDFDPLISEEAKRRRADSFDAPRSPEMSFREGVTGAGLQILFNATARRSFRELHDNVDAPGLAVGSM